MTEKGYSRRTTAHSKIESKEAYLICELAKKFYPNGYGDGIDKDRKIADQVNSVWNNNRTAKDIKSFLRHADREGLTLDDFCD